MAATDRPTKVNSATTIADPGQTTDAFGVRRANNIYIVAATASFTANSVACNPGDISLFLGNNPLYVSGAVTSATVGTILYYEAP
jgi:hypothetical protein